MKKKNKGFAMEIALLTFIVVCMFTAMLLNSYSVYTRTSRLFAQYPQLQEAWYAGEQWCSYVLLTDTINTATVSIVKDKGLPRSVIGGNMFTQEIQVSNYTSTVIPFSTGRLYIGLYTDPSPTLQQPFIQQFVCDVNYFPQLPETGNMSSVLDYMARIKMERYITIDPLSTYISVYPMGITYSTPAYVWHALEK